MQYETRVKVCGRKWSTWQPVDGDVVAEISTMLSAQVGTFTVERVQWVGSDQVRQWRTR